jgi:hypothetical protein
MHPVVNLICAGGEPSRKFDSCVQLNFVGVEVDVHTARCTEKIFPQTLRESLPSPFSLKIFPSFPSKFLGITSLAREVRESLLKM